MEISIIKIGNSKGIRLPAVVLKKYNFKDKVNLILKDEYIIIQPVKQPRRGWDAAFKKMHENDDDKLLIDDFFEDETNNEWI